MTSAGPPSLAGALVGYALARAALVAVVAGLLVLADVPLLIALLVALVVALPLSMVLFRGLRVQLTAALAERGQQRAALRARLRGADPDGGAGGPVERASSDGGGPDETATPDGPVPATDETRTSGDCEGGRGRH